MQLYAFRVICRERHGGGTVVIQASSLSSACRILRADGRYDFDIDGDEVIGRPLEKDSIEDDPGIVFEGIYYYE
jgi:hypothetical protein